MIGKNMYRLIGNQNKSDVIRLSYIIYGSLFFSLFTEEIA